MSHCGPVGTVCHHLPPVVRCKLSPHGSSFASQALRGLGPGQAPARSIQKPFTVGIKAACVGPERQALPCPIALSPGISVRFVWG